MRADRRQTTGGRRRRRTGADVTRSSCSPTTSRLSAAAACSGRSSTSSTCPSYGFEPLVVTGRPRWCFAARRPRRCSARSRRAPWWSRLRRSRSTTCRARSTASCAAFGIASRLVRGALWPDPLVGWIPAAVWRALRLIREHRPSVLYSTSLPATSHLAALIVHRLTGLPWVADFRDALTYDPDPSLHPLPPAQCVYRRPGAPGRAARPGTRPSPATASTCSDLGRDDRRRRLIPNGVDLDDIATDLGPSYGAARSVSASPTSARSTATVMPGPCSTRCGRSWTRGVIDPAGSRSALWATRSVASAGDMPRPRHVHRVRRSSHRGGRDAQLHGAHLPCTRARPGRLGEDLRVPDLGSPGAVRG